MNILHLSDIHFGRNYERTNIKEPFKNRKNIMDELLDCIGNIKEFGKLEHIVVTGDIAWWGKKDEYQEAKEWFLKLLQITGLTGKNISFCVGNHDINRSYGKNIDDITDDAIDKIDEAYDYCNIQNYEAATQEYELFCSEIGVEPYKYFVNGKNEYSFSVGYKDVVFKSGSNIRLISFNTAMLSFGNNINEDKMWIGKPQIETMMEYGILPKGKECKFSIALMHHAERFLHPNEISEYDSRVATLPLLMDNVDLILCGHTETGGRPVLKKQAGGGQILTAGATYYNDVHSNSFSMIYVPDEGKGFGFQMYMYSSGWKKFEKHLDMPKVKNIKLVPPIGEIKERCEFIVSTDKEEYRILLKAISVSLFMKNGEQYCRLDNRKDVTRNLDVICEGPIAGGTASADAKLSSRKLESVEAMLETEKYFYFLDTKVRLAKNSEFSIKSETGGVILHGNNISIGEDVRADKRGIEILEKLVKIENAFDIRLVRPNDVYELDDLRTDLLVDLVNNGFTEKIQIEKKVDFNVDSIEKLTFMYHKASAGIKFRLIHRGNYVCNFFGYTIKMNNFFVITEAYDVDLDDLKTKIETYKDGDIRKIVLKAGEGQKTYFIKDEKIFDSIRKDGDYEEIGIGHMGIDNGFIREDF